MAFDPFGLGKEVPPGAYSTSTSRPPAARPPEKKGGIWGTLLTLDVVLICVFGAALSARFMTLMETPAAVPAPRKPEAVKPPPAPAPEPAKPVEPPPAPAEKKPAPAPAPKPAPAAVQREETRKTPLGSPSLMAPDLPQRGASAQGTPRASDTPKASKPAGKPASATARAGEGKPGAKVKPVEFSYSAPNAKQVFLLGAFLVRSDGRQAMEIDADGVWHATVFLNKGNSYKYRFDIIEYNNKRVVTSKHSIQVF